MTTGSAPRRWLALASVLAALGASAAAAASDAGDPERGRSIYHEGVTGDGGKIEAALGDDGFLVDASVLPCASCHGRDGQGKPEGGISPSNLTWPSLTHPRGGRGASGRTHPPYDERSVIRAITMGLDPAGNALSSTMPRYHLSHRDAADLVAYLRHLEDRRDPGISDDTLVLGTLRVPGTAQAAAVEGCLRAFFDELNARGGLYGRKVRLRTLDLPAAETGEELTADLLAQLAEDPPFALVAADMGWREATLARLFDAEDLPVIGPFAIQPQLATPPNRNVFYLLGGVEEQARALLDFASNEPAGHPHGGRLLIVVPEVTATGGDREHSAEGWLRTAKAQAGRGGWSEIMTPGLEEVISGAGLAPRLAGDTVLVLAGGSQLSRFLTGADTAGWHPRVLVPGVFAGANVLSAPTGFDGQLYLAFPVLPTDARPDRLEEVWQLAERHALTKSHLAAQLSAIAAAEVLVEALGRAGRELSREGLIESLEDLYDHPTGLLPAVSFNANRRLGALGAHIVKANLQTRNFEPTGPRVIPR